MGAVIQVFEATDQSFQNGQYWAIGIAILCIVISVFILFLKKQISYNYRLLLSMLFFFFATTAAGKAYLDELTRGEQGVITIHEKGIAVPQGTYEYAEIRDAFIYTDQQKSMVNPNLVQKTAKSLMIELNDGKRLQFQEAYYPIREIFDTLKNQVNKRN